MGVGEYIISPIFRAGGYDWSIVFYPNGIDYHCAGYTSAYASYLSQTIDVSVKYALSVKRKEGQAPLASFGPRKQVLSPGRYCSVGYPRFVERSKLNMLSTIRGPRQIMSFRYFTDSTATLSLEVSNYLQAYSSSALASPLARPVCKVGGYDWKIVFYPDGYRWNSESDGYASCYLYYLSQGNDDVSVMATFSMLQKKGHEEVVSHNGCKRVFSSGTFAHLTWGYSKFVDKAKLESLSQQGDGGCFTILCALTVTKESPQPPLDLPGHIEAMLMDERGMDVTFMVGGQEYRAHRIVLAARSPVFSAMLLGPMAEKDMRSIDVADMHPPYLQEDTSLYLHELAAKM
ncbi:hypothetical protein ACQ4PT_041367 [Festuca glaucescens]